MKAVTIDRRRWVDDNGRERRRSGGMEDAAVSKTAGLKPVSVRIRPSAPAPHSFNLALWVARRLSISAICVVYARCSPSLMPLALYAGVSDADFYPLTADCQLP